MRRRGLLLAAWAWAAAASAAGVTGADVLKARLSARGAALAEAGAALPQDLAGFSYNPAGLARLAGPRLSFLHYSQAAQVGLEHLTYAHPLDFGVLGAELLFRGQPDIDNPLAVDAPVSAWDLTLGAALAVQPGRWLADLPEPLAQADAGVTLRWVRSHLGRVDGDAFAADLGLQAPLGEGLRGGVALLNLGTPMKFLQEADPLPTLVQAGVLRSFEPLWGHQLNVLADLEAPFLGALRLHFGLEDWMGPGFALRLGYLLDDEQSLNNGPTAGFGLRLNQEGLVFSFDYAFRPLYYNGFSSFEAQHLFGVQLGF